MIVLRRRVWVWVVALAIGGLFTGANLRAADDKKAEQEPATSPPPGAFTLVVMDPLALPLSCPCVKGYAQRDYEKLARHLEARIHRTVYVAFADSLPAALAKKTSGQADLVIGKDSVVRRQSQKAGLKLTHVAALSGLDGTTTQNGLIVVAAEDKALAVADIKGYRIFLGPNDCDEKHLAANNLIVDSGLEKPKNAETCSACDEGALKILALHNEGTKAATVISSYAKPLLEGCGTIKKGELRVIGETDPVPFVAAFVNEKLAPTERQLVEQALFDVVKDRELSQALETKHGFVRPDAAKVTAKKN